MKKTKKMGFLPVAILAVGMLLSSCSNTADKTADNKGGDESISLKLGAILPLTGDEAMYGEGAKKGMEKAREVMKDKYNMDIEIVYEDSQGNPAKGTTAYKKLVNTDKVDAVISAYSSVSTPISELAEADKIPLLATMASKEEIVQGHDYSARLWITSRQQASTHFHSGLINANDYKRIALLTTNDAFGSSMTKEFESIISEIEGMEVVYSGNYDVQEKDFKSLLLKIKNENPDAIIQAGTTAQELIEILKDKKEMGWEVPLFESTNTTLSEKKFREEAGDSAEGVYTSLIPFDLGATGDDVRAKLSDVDFGDIPLWIGAIGYDCVDIYAQALRKDPEKENLASAIRSLGTFKSSNGDIEVGTDGELNFYFSSAIVRDGNAELVEVEK